MPRSPASPLQHTSQQRSMFAARWCAAWCALVATVTVAAVADACTEVQVRAPTGELVIANALEASGS